MKLKKEMIAMLLAGGQGRRGVLLLPGHSHNAGRQRAEAAEVCYGWGDGHLPGIGSSGCGLRCFPDRESAGDQRTDGVRPQAQFPGVRHLPHCPGCYGAAVLPAYVKKKAPWDWSHGAFLSFRSLHLHSG